MRRFIIFHFCALTFSFIQCFVFSPNKQEIAALTSLIAMYLIFRRDISNGETDKIH